MKYVIILTLLSVIIVNVYGDSYEECENRESGSFVGGTQGCKSYIYCDGDDSYEGMCPSQLLFSTKDGSCAPASDVDCQDGIVTTTTTTTTTTPAPTTTTTRTSTSTTTTTTTTTRAPPVAAPESVEVQVEADDESEEIIEPSEELEEPPPASSAVQVVPDVPTTLSSITTRSPATAVGTTSRPTKDCPTSDKPNEVIFLPSDVSCSEYFVCYHGTPVPMTCSGQLYFDYLTSKCELPERVNCKVGNPAISNPKKDCTVNTFDYFPYPKNCNYFYKCINGFLSLQQCPIGFGWSIERKLCLKLIQGRCPTRAAFEYQETQAWLNSVFVK